jgi:hypothetical protein
MTRTRDDQGRFTVVDNEDIIDAEVIETGTEVAVIEETTAELAVIPEPSQLPDILFEEALLSLDPEKVVLAVTLVERLVPEMREQVGHHGAATIRVDRL